ncbi:structural constituent of cell wall [Salix suchowensis]|nr:structural constituent of cell wall [Salix suchowensis]
MQSLSSRPISIFLLTVVTGFIQATAGPPTFFCGPETRCYLHFIPCPRECPDIYSRDPREKVCYADCNSPHCAAQCKRRKANCEAPGSACYDPRFIGGDGIVFYFHGKSNEHFSLVSDFDLQINSRFIGHRPAGRPRDFTWIQSLGILFNSQTFSLEVTRAASWDSEVDHLKFSYDGKDLKDVKVERVSGKNSAVITLKDKAEIMVSAVPVTKQDDKIHNYRVPANDCFVHLEVQFKFFHLSSKVDGVLGRTYRADFENPAKLGVAMPVLGGENNYRIASLFSTDCNSCIFSPESGSNQETSPVMNYGTLDCTKGASAGYGIVCRK